VGERAPDTTVGLTWSSNKKWVSGYTGSESELFIPAINENLSVTYINDDAFKNNTTITLVDIPENVEVISASAFENCTNLQAVVIPESLIILDAAAFNNCTGLTTIFYNGAEFHGWLLQNFDSDPFFNAAVYAYSETNPFSKGYWHYNAYGRPEIWTGSEHEVSDFAFAMNEDIASYMLLKYRTDAPAVTTLTLPAEYNGLPVTTIKNYSALSGTYGSNLENVTTIIIPEGYTKLNNGSFSGFPNLEHIYLPSTITSLNQDSSFLLSEDLDVYDVVVIPVGSPENEVTGIVLDVGDSSSVIATPTVYEGLIYKVQMPVPTASGYEFAGWYTAAEGGTKLTDNNGISIAPWSGGNNVTLYAHYQESHRW
ncbi:MAG: leucine-rich repeat protein, partial [Christensenellaceae bacterium]|nr:leucine-rich repeat protein [Christensenellaceae bacterium]